MFLAVVEDCPGDDPLVVHQTNAKQLADKRAGESGLHPVDDQVADDDSHCGGTGQTTFSGKPGWSVISRSTWR